MNTLQRLGIISLLAMMPGYFSASAEEGAVDQLTEKNVTTQLAKLIRVSQGQLKEGKFEDALQTLKSAKTLATANNRSEIKLVEARIQRVLEAQKATQEKINKLKAIKLAEPEANTSDAAKDSTVDNSAVTLSLEECIEISIQNNLLLRISRLNDRASDLDLRVAWARYLPDFSFNVDHRGSRGGDSHSNSIGLGGSINQRTPIGTRITLSANESENHPSRRGSRRFSDWGARISQPLWKGAGLDVGLFDIRSSHMNKLISRGNLELDVQDLIFRVKTSYSNCIRRIQTLTVNKRAVASAERFLRLTAARERAGIVTKLDVFNAEVQKGNREETLIRNQTNLENSFDLLKQLMDVDLEDDLMVELDPVDFGEKPPPGAAKAAIIINEAQGTVTLAAKAKDGTVIGKPRIMFKSVPYEKETILKEALENRIDLINSQRALYIQELRTLLDKDGLGQQIDLTASYNRSGQGSNWSQSHGYENHNYTVGLQLSIPWGKVTDKASYERALLNLQRSEIQLKRARTQVHLEVRNILRSLKEARKSILIQGKTVEQAKRSVEAARISFERGLKDSFDVINAEDSLLRAKTDFINRTLDYVVRQAQLEVVTGKATGRIDLKARVRGGEIDSILPKSLQGQRLPRPAPDAKRLDKKNP